MRPGNGPTRSPVGWTVLAAFALAAPGLSLAHPPFGEFDAFGPEDVRSFPSPTDRHPEHDSDLWSYRPPLA